MRTIHELYDQQERSINYLFIDTKRNPLATPQHLHPATFTTKEEYLVWRAEWKARYAALTKEIRDYKQNMKLPHNRRYQPATKSTRTRWECYVHAIYLLHLRAISKERAEAQYEQEHTTTPSA